MTPAAARNPNKPPPRRQRDRMVALFLLALLLFNPPLLRLFGTDGTLFGLPLLYAYALGSWALVILLAAAVMHRR